MIGRMEGAGRILDDLRELVVRESPSDDPGRVSDLAVWIRDCLNREGVTAQVVPCPPRGHAVVSTLGSDHTQPSTLLLGHIDTVWPVGTLADFPFEVQGEIVRGPGCFDMKAGVAVAIHVMSRLQRQGSSPKVTLLLVPDEEVGSAASSALLIDLAKKHDRVLVLEPSAPGGAAKVARKGTGLFAANFVGIPSHAGLDPERGASALKALAELVLDSAKFANASEGTTLTPTIASAGTRFNVVPEHAALTLDCRVWTASEQLRIERDLRAWRPRDARVKVSIEGGFDRPPMVETDVSRGLFERARAIAKGLGFELAGQKVGGASDGNLTSAAGVPTLDGLGPRGDGAHARHEHVVVSDLGMRVELIHALVAGNQPGKP
jgi:glutamate carboxypeptidase